MRFFLGQKILPRFFRLREIHKKLRFLTIFGPHTNKWGLRPELSLCLTSTYPLQQLTAISFESATKIFFRKNHDPLPSIKFAPGKNI
jgi:hypothetical protein